MIGWLRRLLGPPTLYFDGVPSRSDIMARLRALPELPESARMRLRHPVEKPRSFREWCERYQDRKRA